MSGACKAPSNMEMELAAGLAAGSRGALARLIFVPNALLYC